jgi:hypothetical protein
MDRAAVDLEACAGEFLCEFYPRLAATVDRYVQDPIRIRRPFDDRLEQQPTLCKRRERAICRTYCLRSRHVEGAQGRALAARRGPSRGFVTPRAPQSYAWCVDEDTQLKTKIATEDWQASREFVEHAVVGAQRLRATARNAYR